jgi:hypothetical protein
MQHRRGHGFGGRDHGARVRIEQIGRGRRSCHTPVGVIRAGFGLIQNELELAIETHERDPNQQNHPKRFMTEARGQ